MNATVELNTTVDKALMQEASAIYAEAGVSISEVLNHILRRTVAEHAVPLDWMIPNAETREAMEDARAGRNMIHASSLEDLFAQLNSEEE